MTRITVTNLGESPLGPVAAIRKLLAATPTTPNNSLFQLFKDSSRAPVTDSKARKHLKNVFVLTYINIFTFNDFRPGGASWAINHGIPMHSSS